MKRSGILLACLLLVTGGCYTYSDAPSGSVPHAGSVVRVQLTEQGARDLRPRTGGARQVFGRVQSRTVDSVTLSVRESAGDRVDALGVTRDSLTLAISSVEGWRRQEFSALRTAGVVLGVAGAAVLTAEVLVSGNGGSDGNDFLDDRGTEGSLRARPSPVPRQEPVAPAPPLLMRWRLAIP